MTFELRILGSNSALPAHGRFPSSQVLSARDQLLLIDCGEGTQMQLSKYQIRRNKISHIFITHMHGDHVYGLPGLLSSFNHFSRTEPLTVFGPLGLRSWLEHIFLISEVHLNYELNIYEIGESKQHPTIFDDVGLSVKAFPLIHRVPTWGYRFDLEQQDYNLDPDSIDKFKLTVEEIRSVKKGINVKREGVDIPFDQLVLPRPAPISYAYCSDTIYTESIIPFIESVDLLYHEATFTSELNEKAKETKHATARQAAEIAQKANAGKLLVGHYSSRYKDLSGHLDEARAVFPETYLAREGDIWEIN